MTQFTYNHRSIQLPFHFKSDHVSLDLNKNFCENVKLSTRYFSHNCVYR